MKNKSLKLFVLLFMAVVSTAYSQYATNAAQIKNVQFDVNNQTITITYDLIGDAANHDYYVWADAYYKSGTKIIATAFSGDVENTKPGIQKKIHWNLATDKLELDDNIYIKVSATARPSIPNLDETLIQSALYPGLGNYAYSNNKRAFITGAIGFGSIAGALYFRNQGLSNYTDYKRSQTNQQAEDFYSKSRNAQLFSYACTGLAAATWTFSLTDVILKHKKAKRNIPTIESTPKLLPKNVPQGQLVSSISPTKYVNNRKAEEPPQLVIDKNNVLFVEVNNNQKIEPYEPCIIKFNVANTGKGKAYDLVATIEETNNISGLNFEQQIFIGSLQSGQNTTVSVPVLGNREMKTGNANFRITVADANDNQASPFEIGVATREDEAYRQLVSEIESVSTNLEKELKEYTQKLVETGTITKNVATNVNAKVQTDTTSDGEHQLNLHVDYQYEVKRTFSGVNDDFAPGKYEITDSKAANATMTVFKQTIEEELIKYFRKGTQVTVKIKGSTDSSPIRSKIDYNGAFGELVNQPYFDRDGLLAKATITNQSGITTNEQLGYLRTYSVRNYITNLVAPFKKTDNHFEHHVVVATEAGAQHRKVSIEMIIHNPFEELQQKQEEAIKKFEEAKKTADNNSDNQPKSDVDENIPEINGRRTNTYALIIGNEDYTKYQTGGESEVNVDFANRDAEIFAKYVEKTMGVPKENITLLQDAISSQMVREIERLTKMAEYGDGDTELIFYYAGHGLPHEETKEGYIMPVDILGTEIERGIKLNDLYKQLTEYNPQKVTVFIDACFSGGGRNSGLLSARAVKVKPKENIVEGNIVIYTASSGSQTSLPYKDKYHGIFTYYLLKALQMNRGKISYQELSNYIKKNVQLTSAKINYKDQNPETLVSRDVINTWTNWSVR